MRGLFGSLVTADDDAAGVEIVIERLGLAQKLRAEQNVGHAKTLADVPGVADGNGGLDHNGGLGFALGGAVLYKLQHRLHGRAVEVIGLGIVIRGNGQNDEIRICIGGGTVGGGGQLQAALSGFGLSQILFDVIVLNGGLVVIDQLGLFGLCAHSSDLVVLREQNRQRQSDVSHTGYGDFVALFHADRIAGLLDKQFGQVEIERGGERFKLGDGRRIAPGLEIRENGAAHTCASGELSLGELQSLSPGDHSFRQQRKG